MSDKERGEEDDCEVYHQRCSNPDNRDDLVDYVITLRSEEHDNGIEEPDERPRRYQLDEHLVIPFGASQLAKAEPRNDCGSKRDAEESSDALGDGRVSDVERAFLVADHLDE